MISRLKARAEYYLMAMAGRAPTYPIRCAVSAPNQITIDFIRRTNCLVIAELGVYRGHTSEKFAEYLNGRGVLHLFDFEDRVREVKDRLNKAGYHNIVGHGNSRKLMDSYNWSLMRLLQASPEPIFDYVFLDGAHTWNIDALAFLLIDRLLREGGYVDFDDYGWSLASSPTMNPISFPPTAEMYTAEQINTQHVRLIVDLLVRPNPDYVEIVENKIFQKTSAKWKQAGN
jgi:predicted O-methyltransferase YrrM